MMNNLNKEYPLLDSMRIKRSTCLDKTIFRSNNIHIIGQANDQLIFCFLINERLVLVFDQHAVHERIRYERILNSAFVYQPNVSRKMLATHSIVPPSEISIPKELCEKIKLVKDEIESFLGVKFSIKNDNIMIINRMVNCFEDFNHPGLLQDFFIDTLNYFDSEKHIASPMTPFLLEKIRTKACHGAIRFNEKLNSKECCDMIKELTNCKSCFRCAHGRVLVKPLLYIPNKCTDRLNYERKLKTSFMKNYPIVETQFEKKMETQNYNN